MKGNEARVLLDLNYPGFQSELFDLDAPELKKIVKTLKKLRGYRGRTYSATRVCTGKKSRA